MAYSKFQITFSKTYSQLNCGVPRWKIKETLENDFQTIKKSARAYGYYHLSIERNVVRKNDCWLINLTFIEGPRVVVEKVDVKIFGDAKNDQKFMRSIQANQIEIGDPLLHSHYEQLKKRLDCS